MYKSIPLFSLFIFCALNAQEAVYNTGNLKIHSDGQVGFHTNFINDGVSDNNEGFTGFYNRTKSLTISGLNEPSFNDFEVAVDDDLNLEVTTIVRGILDFSSGRVTTPRDSPSVNLDFRNDAIYTGETDDKYIDGYAFTQTDLDFTFPVGDRFRLRPISITAAENGSFLAAYFYENPNTPSTFSEVFRTDRYESVLSIISTQEFWHLDGDQQTNATLTWNVLSNVRFLASNLDHLRVVGFNKTEQQWIDLGNINTSGTFIEGEITSEPFIPSNYEILTIGSVLAGNRSISGFNIITPNGDGLNDFLVFEGVITNPNNKLTIVNRWGKPVYTKVSYDNSFNGISQGSDVVQKGVALPVGTYYYVLELKGEEDVIGPIYINR